MGKLRIFASGRSQHIRNQARGKLFAEMMTRVLNHDGYHADHILHSDFAQMEIDVQGKHRETGFPFYAACRFSETPMPERDLQAFFGRYMIKWHTDRRCHGLFVVLPGLDGAAIKFYREHIKNNTHVTTFLYDEDDALKAISEMPGYVSPDRMAGRIPPDIGKPGEGILLYTEKGMFWACPVISHGEKTPDKIAFFDGKGELISDRSIIGYLTKLDPEIANFDNISGDKTGPLQPGLFQDADPIVEVNGSSSCFEYQFPASPRYFVGRKSLFSTLDSFSGQVIRRRTTHRGIVFEGPTGWGKSSMVLASVAHLQKIGHFAVVVDCRTASSSTFIPRVIEYTVGKFGDLAGRIVETNQKKKVSGFDSAVRMIFDTGQILESQNKLLFIFFDPFENILFLPDVLDQVKNLFLKIVEKQTNIILGFTSSHAFSNKQLDGVADECRKMILTTFSRAQTGVFLKKLGKELDETLTKGLQSFLEKFSRGYPWLLKMLCFHVMVARQSGIPQSDIPGILLGIEELFRYELQNLSDTERAALHQIAETIPGRPSALLETFDPRAVQKLIHQGLINKIGNTVDISWNIFRDYLNTGDLPFQDHYLLDTAVGKVLHGLNILHAAEGILDVSEFKNQISCSEFAFYGLAKDMDLLGLVRFAQGTVFLQFDMSDANREMEALLRNHLRNRLHKNRLVSEILNALKDNYRLTMADISSRLESLFPFVKMTRLAWLKKTRILAEWLDAADLALLNKKDKTLVYFDPKTDIRERNLFLPKRRGGKTSRIQYATVENIAIRLVHALQKDGRVNWTGLHKNTIFRALATLEDLGFILRKAPLIKVLPRAKAFVENSNNRPFLFAEGALKLASFSVFIDILKSKQITGGTILELGRELQEKLGENWKKSTSETIAKIMLDWARHTNLAPGVFAKIRKGPIKGWKKKENSQMSLF
ncbi:MAG: hypothetical protein JRE28_03740 [Deltaproteobacteria bacterium]|nr:hypothetical protein [Deltaproteobacteria bacterium]